MKLIASVALALTIAAPALADPAPGRYCAHQAGVAKPPGASPYGSEIPALDVVLDIENRQGASWITFRDAVHDGPDALAAGPVAGTPMPGGAISFSFSDARGVSGDGTLSPSGVLSLHRTPGVPGGNSGLDKIYGAFRLSAASCTDADKALKLTK